MKIPNLRICLVAIAVLSLLLSPVATGYAKGTTDSEIQLTVSTNPSSEDSNWPIIKTEQKSIKDPSTGQETVVTFVTRRGPASEDQIPCKDEKGNITNDAKTVARAMATCVLGRTSLTTPGNNTAGGVTGYVKVFSNEYCSGIDCDYRKITKIQLWWKRTSTGWVVRSARMRWGCNGACAICPNNVSYGTYRESGLFTPNFNGGLTSSTYTWTRTDWPIMKTTELGDHFGYSRSVPESPSHQTYVLEVWAILP